MLDLKRLNKVRVLRQMLAEGHVYLVYFVNITNNEDIKIVYKTFFFKSICAFFI